ncbi:hypothetical protein SETIT_3G133600v2 [Setaria italica]|uniref:DUF6598 domain-containing protein n=1 Tax=Setaria italica TaxID=4555 RepID=A0A368QET1_SETIT|nr:hypothetical protein SETIT_3G133600v2 [Setaria italica]
MTMTTTASSSEEEVHDGGSSVGTELALELARWEVEWVPEPEPTEEDKAVEALHLVLCRQFTEHDPKLGYPVPTRLCQFNIALFDFEKESMAGLGQPLCTLDLSDWMSLEDSINVVSLKVAESVGYPISVFGTVLARDQVDYKCVYLFRRDREDPQVVTSPDDALTLTGPCQGLAATSHTFFEVNLKIRSDDGDKDFSEGVGSVWLQ